MKVVVLAINAFLDTNAVELVILMSDNVIVVIEKAKEHSVKSIVRSGAEGRPMDRDPLSSSFSEVNPLEEEHSGGTAESPRPGPSHRKVSSSPGFRSGLRGLWLPSYRFVCYKSKHLAAYLHVTGSRSHGLEAGCLLTPMGQPKLLRISPICCFLSGIFMSKAFDDALLSSDGSSVVAEGVVH